MELQSLAVRIARSENLPVLPQAVSAVMKLVDDPDASPRELEQAIERDPAITAKVLRAANSAYYGGQSVPTIGRAISFLGLNAIRSLVVSVAYQQMLSGRSPCPSLNKVELWRHSVAVATAARIVGKIKSPGRAEELFCAGIMHDIGILVLERFAGHELHTAIGITQSRGWPLQAALLDVLGFDHTQVGNLLAERWALSPTLTAAVSHHLDPIRDEHHFETTCYVHAADVLAEQAGFQFVKCMNPPMLDPTAEQAIGLPAEQYDIIREVMVQEVQRAQDAFQIAA